VLDKPRRLGDDLIFRSKQGKQFRQESQWRAWDPVRRAFTASLPITHHLRERVAADEQDQLDVYELRHFGASYMLNELELEPWVIAEQLRHTDGGRLVLELYGHPDRKGPSTASVAPTLDPPWPALGGQRPVSRRPIRGDSGDGRDGNTRFPGMSGESNLFPPPPKAPPRGAFVVLRATA
jgi:hypothetical protein